MQQILAENTISIYDLFARTLNMFIFNDKFMPYFNWKSVLFAVC